MSIDSRPHRPEGLKDVKLAVRPAASERDGALEAVSDAADAVLAPLDMFKDRLAGDLSRATRTVEAKASRIPVLAQLTQFGSGVVSATWSMAEGTYNTFRHPVQTLQGLWGMASHVPVVSPIWWVNGVKDGFSKTLEGDKVFWKAVGQGFIAPYAKDWGEGRYFAVAGRAAVDVGTLYIGLKNAKAAFDGWKARRGAAGAVDDVARMRPEALDDGLRQATVGTEPRVVGSVVEEGVTVVKSAKGAKAPARQPKRVRLEGTFEELDKSKLGRIKVDKDTYRRLRQVGPERMQRDAVVKSNFRKLTRSVDGRIDGELTRILGVKPSGAPKQIDRAAAKLVKLREEWNPNLRLGGLDDLARGRIDLPEFKPAQMKGMLEKIRTHFGDDNLMINNYMTTGKPFYRGRLHIKIKDRSGLWYELQIGPRQLSEFYDSKFMLGKKATNLHDAVYKGVMRLDADAAALLGKGDKLAGQARLTGVLDMYVENMNEVIALAKKGQPYNYVERTAALRGALNQLFADLPIEKLPVTLR